MPPRSPKKATKAPPAKRTPRAGKKRGAVQIPCLPIRIEDCLPPPTVGTGEQIEIQPEECGLCSLVAQTLTGRPGFLMAIDGNAVLLNDYPSTGGPWLLAFTNQGVPTWINGGGL